MLNTFTQNLLIKYLYKECTEKEQAIVEQALVSDDSLMNRFTALQQTTEEIDGIIDEPSDSTVNNIMRYVHLQGKGTLVR